MADGYTMRVVLNHFPSIKEQLHVAADELVHKVAGDIQREAQANAPVLTGYLRDHINLVEVGFAHVQVVSLADYSGYVELGTRFHAPHPFFFMAAEHQWDNYVQAFRDLQAKLR